MEIAYKADRTNFLKNRINNKALENKSAELEIIQILLDFMASLEAEDKVYDSNYENEIVNRLNKIHDADPEKYDMCNHPCFISKSIFLNILSFFKPGTPFIIVTSASFAISSFSYLFSMYPNSNCQFNMSDLFLILQPEVFSFIIDCIKENINEDISSITLMLRKYCIASKKFRDDLISIFSIDEISDLIAYGNENNCDIDWVKNLVSLVCDICFHPIDEPHAASIISIFYGFDLFSTPIDIICQIFHAIRYIIEKNSNKIENESEQITTETGGNLTGNSAGDIWNPAPLILNWNFSKQFDQLFKKMNRFKDYKDDSYKILLTRFKDDLCSISLSIYQLTGKEFLLLPISDFIDFMKYDEEEAGETKVKQNLVYNSLLFFSIYMNEKEENFVFCNQNEFFNYLNVAIKQLSAKIRICAGNVLFGLIQKADCDLLKTLLIQGFFVWAYKLILLDDSLLSIKMLRVMQIFIQFVIDVGDIHLAEILNSNWMESEYNMYETLNSLFLNDDDEVEETNKQLKSDLSNTAYLTLEMINNCFVQYEFIKEPEEEEEDDENKYLFNIQYGEEEDEDQNDIDINFEKADQIFNNTKPNPLIPFKK